MKLKLVILATLFFQVSIAQFTNTDVVAKIKTVTIDDVISVVATATNTTEVHKSLQYTISVFRTDVDNNISKTNQEGRFTLEANENKELSRGSISVDESDKIVLLLLIYEEDKIIGKDRLAFNEKNNQEPKKAEEDISSDDGIELKGIVIEETKTKPGRDFYEFFYASYTLNQINGNKVVGVYEKLSFGRSTIIQVKIEDNVIHEFIGKPDLEYLEQMSKIAIRKVYKYFKDLKKQKNDIFQY
ncbi:Curli assembly protein CsgE [Aquimarina sp. MAR_2010_214]|uniref:CsgE family curli-type amyloid fiber assembly protein n=1 Tax=Aquimarina sp. MAR_2010_214 TaxID=1250026 RepID=UPI000C702417|nr:CsgE family curli-type amyloid fiber assembly protein [Aquimarina sp. MAR_2010_214]PKV52540.1 Curli assembly protein CsgE [Aquimarina sp. MAR_2010_214]